jgi:hypothetical protein
MKLYSNATYYDNDCLFFFRDASVVFDPAKLISANPADNDFQLRVQLSEIDLWDLVPVHALVKNSPVVSAACGKWTASTSVR